MAATGRPLIVFVSMLVGALGLSAFDLESRDGCNGRRILCDSAGTNIEPRDALFRNSVVQLDDVKVLPDDPGHTSASDNLHFNYPQPGRAPSPDRFEHPPPASWSLKAANVHTDYAPVHPTPTPDYHDYPSPPVNFHSDYAPAHINPSLITTTIRRVL